jgi:hypothetical protein
MQNEIMSINANSGTIGKQVPGTEILLQLHNKFSANLTQTTTMSAPLLEQVEIKTRAVAEFGQLLRHSAGLSPSQVLLASVADEIFADVTSAVYLAAACLGSPTPMLLRRALELGLALIYLWDLPHLFWGWKDCDQDLSFKEMVAHVESASFCALLRNTGVSNESGIDTTSINCVYRNLSNIIHGKFRTMATLSNSSYSWDSVEWSKHLALTEQVLDIILKLWGTRFPEIRVNLDKEFPQLLRVE